MIRLGDGVEIDLGDGRTLVADARNPAGDLAVVSHAHADHLLGRDPDRPVIASRLTAALAAARADLDPFPVEDAADGVTLHPAGHVLGSRAALVDADRRVLYTGDVCTRERCYLPGFEPVDADVLIVEATYGRPDYRFPPHDEVEDRIVEWITANRDRPVFLFGYSLGRAQKLQSIVDTRLGAEVHVHDAVARVNDVIERETEVSFPTRRFDPDGDVEPGGLYLLPSNRSRADAIDRLVERTGAVTAGFSGWAVKDAYRFRGGYDAAFPLSDHCDFDELVDLVTAVDPDVVYTHHGFDEGFADHLRREHGYDARPLLRDQTSLLEFCSERYQD